MIRRNFFTERGMHFCAPDKGGSPAPVPAEVTETHNADLHDEKPNDPAAAADKAKLPDAPPVNSAAAAPADKNAVLDNPHKQTNNGKVTMHRVEVVKLAIYERDGKHVAGDKVYVTAARADELISTGYAKDLGESEEINIRDAVAFLAKNDPPRV